MPPAPPGRPPERPLILVLLAAVVLVAMPGLGAGLPLAMAGDSPQAPAELADLDWQGLRERGLRLDRDDIMGAGGLQATVVALDGCDGALVGMYGLIATTYRCARRLIQTGEVPAPVPPGGGFAAATWADEIPLPGRQGRLVPLDAGAATRQPERVDLGVAWLPPPGVGFFGGAGEDGVWPSHRGDFALLRAWTGGGEGEATPYRPARFLAIDTKGVRPGDLVLAMGHGAGGAAAVAAGTVKGYSPADAVWLESQSTLTGQVEKLTGEPPYVLPEPVLAAVRDLDPGRWRQAGLDAVPVGFVADVGSAAMAPGGPLLDGRGRLVGLTLDRVAGRGGGRTVAVDMRYLLWLLERVDGAWGLMRDLGVEPRAPQPAATP